MWLVRGQQAGAWWQSPPKFCPQVLLRGSWSVGESQDQRDASVMPACCSPLPQFILLPMYSQLDRWLQDPTPPPQGWNPRTSQVLPGAELHSPETVPTFVKGHAGLEDFLVPQKLRPGSTLDVAWQAWVLLWGKFLNIRGGSLHVQL